MAQKNLTLTQRVLSPVREYLAVTVSEPCKDINHVYKENAPNRIPRRKTASLIGIARKQQRAVSADGRVRPAGHPSVTAMHRIAMFNGLNHVPR